MTLIGHVNTGLGRIELHHQAGHFVTRRSYTDFITGQARDSVIVMFPDGAREWYELCDREGAVYGGFPGGHLCPLRVWGVWLSDDLAPIYYRVSPAIWRQPWSEDMRTLAVYLLTCPHRTIEGLFLLPKPYICGDMKWNPERLDKPFAELLADGFIDYDEDAQVCLIVKALEYQTPSNGNMDTAAVRRLKMVPKTRLDGPFLLSAVHHCQRFAKRLREALPQRFGESLLCSSSTLLSSTLSAGGREASPEAPPARAHIKDGTMTLCPECATQVTYDDRGEHCPRCEWRLAVPA